MATVPQIVANQANATHSTGPKTVEGKARSAANALAHGLTARELHLTDDERPAFEEMRSEFELQFCPRGMAEQHLFDQFILAAWNLRRAAALSASINPLDDKQAAAFHRVELYQRRIERSYYRSMAELRALQTERLTRDALLSDAEDSETKEGALVMPLVNWPKLRAAVFSEQATKQRITDTSYRRMLDQMMEAPPGASFSVTRFDH